METYLEIPIFHSDIKYIDEINDKLNILNKQFYNKIYNNFLFNNFEYEYEHDHKHEHEHEHEYKHKQEENYNKYNKKNYIKKAVFYMKVNDELNENKKTIMKCPICYEINLNKKNYLKLLCNHTFCNKCYNSWNNKCSSQNISTSCPICRDIVI